MALGSRITEDHAARLGRLLSLPTRYVHRCAERVSFLPSGGMRWTRTIQIEVPPLRQLEGHPSDDWHVISLGMFERRRFPDIVVTDAARRRLNLLTRQEHGVVLANAVLTTYLLAFLPIRDVREKIKSDPLASRINSEIVAMTTRMFMSVERSVDPYSDEPNDRVIGVVTFEGAKNPNGQHTPLVERETFERVQQLLEARALAGDRSRKHQHYLKGSVFCGRCGSRLFYNPVRGNGGSYIYFTCQARQRRGDRRCGLQPTTPTRFSKHLKRRSPCSTVRGRHTVSRRRWCGG
jgi:hypothetical protein